MSDEMEDRQAGKITDGRGEMINWISVVEREQMDCSDRP